MSLKLTSCFLFFLAFTSFAHGQSATLPRVNTLEITEPSPTGAPRSGLQSKLFEIKYRNPKEIADAVRGLSISPGVVQYNEKLQVVTVIDFPENISAIEAAIKRLDIPESAPASFDIRLHVLATSGVDEKGGVPSDLEPVVAQLRKTLKYQRYAYITTFTGRVQNGETFSATGVAPSIAKTSSRSAEKSPATFQMQVPEEDRYTYKFGKIRLATDGEGRETLQISQFGFTVSIAGKGDIIINTSLNLREGENVVVGTTSVGENALVVVVSAKKIN
jgi:hypothetical protein